jgi:type IV secretory pathway component VirB8
MRTTTLAEPSYFEKLASAEIQCAHLKILTAGLLLVSGLLGAGWYRAQRPPETMQTIVVSTDDTGKWHVTDPGEIRYKPEEQVIKYFLTTFVMAHFSRERATVKRDFERSLLFFDSSLADTIIDAERKSQSVQKFLAEGLDEETLIRVSNIAIEDQTGPVYRADINYDRILARDHRERLREHHLLHVSFVMKQPVPVELIPVNPLGFLIVSMSDSGPEQTK